MSRKNLETLVLALGLIVIGAAVFFIFIRQQTPNSIFITNLIISLGFLIYVVYSIMATNSLNREIRHLAKHVESLKTEISKKNNLLEERQARIDALEKDLANREDELESARAEIANLEQQMSDLQPPEAGQK